MVHAKCIDSDFNWVETHQRQYSGHNTLLSHHTDRGTMCLGQYHLYSLGEYCGPHSAFSVLLVCPALYKKLFKNTSLKLILANEGCLAQGFSVSHARLCLSSLTEQFYVPPTIKVHWFV